MLRRVEDQRRVEDGEAERREDLNEEQRGRSLRSRGKPPCQKIHPTLISPVTRQNVNSSLLMAFWAIHLAQHRTGAYATSRVHVRLAGDASALLVYILADARVFRPDCAFIPARLGEMEPAPARKGKMSTVTFHAEIEHALPHFLRRG